LTGVPVMTLPAPSTTAHNRSDGHEMASNEFVPSTSSRCHAAAPCAGELELVSQPSRSAPPRAQNESDAHEIVGSTLGAPACVRVQAGCVLQGLAEVSNAPSTSATHNEEDGHETVESPRLLLTTRARVHADAPPVGFVEVKTLPASSTATHAWQTGTTLHRGQPCRRRCGWCRHARRAMSRLVRLGRLTSRRCRRTRRPRKASTTGTRCRLGS
jgi:hypothetical protein